MAEEGIESTPAKKSTSGVTSNLLFAIFAAAFGSAFQHGYNLGVINAPQKVIESWIASVEESRNGEAPTKATVTLIWSIAVSIFCVGGMIGGCSVGYLAEKFGRKGALLYNNILVVFAALAMGCSRLASSYELFILGRCLIGINSGLNAGLVPVYLSEISPVSLRGAVGTVYQLVITISIAASQVLGLETVLGNASWWPTLLSLTVLPAIVQLVTLIRCPESPKHILLSTGNELKAQQVLLWLRERGDLDVNDELEEMKSERGDIISLREILKTPSLRAPLFISLALMLAQQFSGINAVIFFSTSIFRDGGLSEEGSQLATLGMGAVNVGMTVVSLILVEMAGRKTLLLGGFLGSFFSTFLLYLSLLYRGSDILRFVSVGAVILFIISFASGPGSIPWFMVTELFKQPARPVATSAAVAVNWAANFIVAIGFLPLAILMTSHVFIIFLVLQILSIFFIFYKVPETKNKTTEEITSMFEK